MPRSAASTSAERYGLERRTATWSIAEGSNAVWVMAGAKQRPGRAVHTRYRGRLPSPQGGQLAAEHVTLPLPGAQAYGGLELGAGLVGAAEPGEQLAADAREQVRAREVAGLGQRIDQRQGCGRSAGHGDGDGAVELDDRRAGERVEGVVQQDDAVPVGGLDGRRDRVALGDGGLEAVGTEPSPDL